MAAEWIYHAHECALGYRRTNRGVDGRKQKEACHTIPSSKTRRQAGQCTWRLASLRVTTKCQRRFELPMNPNVIDGNPAGRRVVEGSRLAGDEASEEQFAMHLDTVQRLRQTAGTKRGAEDDVMVSPAK